MKCTIIHNTDKWRVDSFGNGLTYLLTDKTNVTSDPEEYELFFQGDDAEAFREAIEDGEKRDMAYNDIFSGIWATHGH